MKKTLQKKLSFYSSLLLFLCFYLVTPVALQAQPLQGDPPYYTSGVLSPPVVFATADSRLVASIEVVDSVVTFEVFMIGKSLAMEVEFPIYYNAEKLKLVDLSLKKEIPFQLPTSSPPSSAIQEALWINPLLPEEWKPGICQHRTGSPGSYQNELNGSFIEGMNLFFGTVFHPTHNIGTYEEVINPEPGEIFPVFRFNFIKKDKNVPLANNDFGFGNNIIYWGPLPFCNWSYDGARVEFMEDMIGRFKAEFIYEEPYSMVYYTRPDWFNFRSPSKVTALTPESDQITEYSADLRGIFERNSNAGLIESDNMLSGYNFTDPDYLNVLTSETEIEHDGILRYDKIIHYGYIYTADKNITIEVDKYSDSLRINGKNYTFPTSSPFTIEGSKPIYYVLEQNSDPYKNIITGQDSEITISGLASGTNYYAWALLGATFETSNEFYLVDPFTFRTKGELDCTPLLSVGSIHTVNDPSCIEPADGAIQFYVSGGTGSYLFSLNGSSDFEVYTDGLIEGLSAGVYWVDVMDADKEECPAATSQKITLYGTGDLSVNVTAVNADYCDGTGELHISVTGETGLVTYFLDGENITSQLQGNVLYGVSVGEHVINVIDESKCTATSGIVNVYANNSDPFVVAFKDAEDASCTTLGSITFSVTGIEDFEYQLNALPHGSGIENTDIVLGNLSAGLHSLKVWNSCTEVVKDILIPNGDDDNSFSVIADVIPEIMDCNNSVILGKIVLTVAGDETRKYSYSYDEGATWNTFEAGTLTDTISGLSGGVYKIEVVSTDLNDEDTCAYAVNNVEIKRIVPETLNIGTLYVANNPSSCSDRDGSIQVVASGGSGAYLYSFDGVTFAAYPNGLIDNLPAGTYYISVQDFQQPGCGTVTNGPLVLYNEGSELQVQVDIFNPTHCNSGDGSLYIMVLGGSADKYYLDGNEITVLDGIYTGILPGYHVIEVTDGNGCTASSGEFHVGSKDANEKIAIAITSTVPTQCEIAIGEAILTVSPSGTYSYQLDGGTEKTTTGTITLTGLSAGIHAVRVWNTCEEATIEVEITNGAGTSGLAFKYTAYDETTDCNGNIAGGEIVLNITGGTPKYQYRIDGGAWKDFENANTTITDLNVGIYKVEVIDEKGCTYEAHNITIKHNVTEILKIGTLFAATNPTCGQNDGKIQVYASGGSGSYLYSYNGGIFTEYEGGLIDQLGAGTYYIEVKDANHSNCPPAKSENITLFNQGSNMEIVVTPNDALVCESQGSLEIAVTGGVAPYKFYLNGLETINEVTIVEGVLSGLNVDVYTVYVMDANRCVASSGEVRISAETPSLTVLKGAQQDASCGSSSGSVIYTVSTTSSDHYYYYQINDYPINTVHHTEPLELNGLSAGVHIVKIWNNCAEIIDTVKIGNGTGALLVTATVIPEVITCNSMKDFGSITLKATDGKPTYQYRYDGGEWINFDNNSETTISDLAVGIYFIEVRDDNFCTYQVNHVKVDRVIEESIISPPAATTPQQFCSGATVANLQVDNSYGVTIKWYDENGDLLTGSDPLENGKIYYAAQIIGSCESTTRTAVTVVIDNEIIIEPPYIVSPQYICSPALIKDIATDGNTNIIWYDAPDGNLLSLTVPLVNGATYYATISAGGNCQSVSMTAVEIIFATDSEIGAPEVETPQYFCKGGLVGNIVVPNHQIVWYDQPTGGTAYSYSAILVDNQFYYAAQKAGGCESSERTKVQIFIDVIPPPSAQELQTFCEKDITTYRIADIAITGAGIVWYNAAGHQLDPLTTYLTNNTTYYATQSTGDCESEKIGITVTNECFTLSGTVFPFVHTDDPVLDALFPTTAKLYPVPDKFTLNWYLITKPVQTVSVSYYDSDTYVPGTPKHPGLMGNLDNPGLPILWQEIHPSYVAGNQNTEVVQHAGDQPDANIGVYTFVGVARGSYILEISRPGFIPRWAPITVTEKLTYLGHREIIAGDINNDLVIDQKDVTTQNSKRAKYPDPNYQPRYDFDGNGSIDTDFDLKLLLKNYGASYGIYKETYEWIFGPYPF